MIEPAQTRPDTLDPLRLTTPFGEFEADSRNIISFPQGLPGFEHCRRFVLLSSPDTAPLQCLHAVDGPPASFLAIDPRCVVPNYRTLLSDADRLRLGDPQKVPLLWLALVTIQEDGSATVNLRAPVVINPTRMVGFQLVPHQSIYPLRFPLGSE